MEKKYVVYQHVTPDGMYYYGQTNDIKRRWSGNGRLYKKTTLQPYIEKYGWDNIQHIVLFENQSKEDALKIEDSLIISGWEKGNCINKIRSGNISREEGYQRKYRREYQREYQRKYQRKYREQNKNRIQEYQREYQREYQQKYYEQNKDRIREYNRQYYKRKKLEKQLKDVVETTLF